MWLPWTHVKLVLAVGFSSYAIALKVAPIAPPKRSAALAALLTGDAADIGEDLVGLVALQADRALIERRCERAAAVVWK